MTVAEGQHIELKMARWINRIVEDREILYLVFLRVGGYADATAACPSQTPSKRSPCQPVKMSCIPVQSRTYVPYYLSYPLLSRHALSISAWRLQNHARHATPSHPAEPRAHFVSYRTWDGFTKLCIKPQLFHKTTIQHMLSRRKWMRHSLFITCLSSRSSASNPLTKSRETWPSSISRRHPPHDPAGFLIRSLMTLESFHI
jgi:hypothetical protein